MKRLLIFFGLLCLLCPSTWAAIAFDNATTGKGTGAATLTFSHTVNSNTNGLLIVGVSYRDDTISGVTYNGVAMTHLMTQTGDGGPKTSQYYLKLPATGAHDVVVSLTNDNVVATAISFTGVHQTSSFGTSVGSGTGSSYDSPITVNASSAAGEWVVDVATVRDVALTVGASQTQRGNDGQGDIYHGASTEPGAATVTMSWTHANGHYHCMVATPIKPAADVTLVSKRALLGVGK